MRMADILLMEFDQEMCNTQQVLERVPADKLDWRPHPKSGTMGWLAAHLANLPAWVTYTLTRDEIDLADPEMHRQTDVPASVQAIMDIFGDNVAAARDALDAASDDALMEPWTLRMGDKVIFTIPRRSVLRVMVLNHTIHHRAQLEVYLRMNDIPLPPIYGPTADENGM